MALERTVKFAYADPPYYGCCQRYAHYHPEGNCWNDLDTHARLIAELVEAFPDGWALSASASSLKQLLPLCPDDVRVAAWVKPFAAFKANVRNAYTWEPVIVRGGRLRSKDGAPVTRDHLTTEAPEALRESITLKKGLTGAKPRRFCQWVLDMLGYVEGDEVVDLFPGTNVMRSVLDAPRLAV